jgi:hypothetical protein
LGKRASGEPDEPLGNPEKPSILGSTTDVMPITVKLNGGVEIHVEDADFLALEQAWEVALAENKPLRIHHPDGRTMMVNPNNVLYFEGPSERAAAANGTTAQTAAPTLA